MIINNLNCILIKVNLFINNKIILKYKRLKNSNKEVNLKINIHGLNLIRIKLKQTIVLSKPLSNMQMMKTQILQIQKKNYQMKNIINHLKKILYLDSKCLINYSNNTINKKNINKKTLQMKMTISNINKPSNKSLNPMVSLQTEREKVKIVHKPQNNFHLLRNQILKYSIQSKQVNW